MMHCVTPPHPLTSSVNTWIPVGKSAHTHFLAEKPFLRHNQQGVLKQSDTRLLMVRGTVQFNTYLVYIVPRSHNGVVPVDADIDDEARTEGMGIQGEEEDEVSSGHDTVSQ